LYISFQLNIYLCFIHHLEDFLYLQTTCSHTKQYINRSISFRLPRVGPLLGVHLAKCIYLKMWSSIFILLPLFYKETGSWRHIHVIASAPMEPTDGFPHNFILSHVEVTYKTGFGLDNWIYCTLYIHTVRNYRQYRAIVILHTLQFTVTHALGLWVFTSRIQATALSQSVTSNHTWSFLPQSNSFLAITSQSPSTAISRTRHISLDYCSVLRPFFWLCPPARTPRKTPSSIVKNTCLLILYLVVDVLLLRALVLRECVYRAVA
jgi:hypothetical protein